MAIYFRVKKQFFYNSFSTTSSFSYTPDVKKMNTFLSKEDQELSIKDYHNLSDIFPVCLGGAMVIIGMLGLIEILPIISHFLQ